MAVLKTHADRSRSLVGCRFYATWLFAFLAFFAAVSIRAQNPLPPAEYQVKAVFLFNFTQFVQWPSKSFSEDQAPLIIGVLGEDPFGAYLDKLVVGEKIEGHPIELRRFHRTDDFTSCHILYISRSESGQLDKIIGRLKGRSVLTVSDAENFSRAGGMIRFVTENGKIRLRVNLTEAKKAELTISSKLLRPATIVTQERD